MDYINPKTGITAGICPGRNPVKDGACLAARKIIICDNLLIPASRGGAFSKYPRNFY
jgi:hypothetical protein